MKSYFERSLVCDCGYSERQTATTIPLDRMGNLFSDQQKKELENKHKKCNTDIKYTSWVMRD